MKCRESWHAVDFYYDHDTDMANNSANWPMRKPTQNPNWDPDLRVFIHVEEYVFFDSKALGPMIAVEYWYYYAYNYMYHFPYTDHPHDWEMHCVLFLDQTSEQPMLVGAAAHWWINYYNWSTVDKESGHPKIYVASGSHVAGTQRDNIPWETWAGDGVKVPYGSFLGVFVLHTNACKDRHYDNYCKIVYNEDWQGNHFYWDWTDKPNSRD